jgi:hypothetical protein
MIIAADQESPDRALRMRDAFHRLKAVFQNLMDDDE